ncbi:hypothetical protein CEUSTIGMA_g2918.t1 [Chlamydomonas eustigma]|uniref:Glutaredoxin domain-containing protein n=1 Tax=Chlamydomonas eustigma TaxID=1157962 RepID=A0A250WXF9_9CHLO|nr:hypothetical protein CEUSTIGMA_g2918.t1 [Chlamydomonas eustigma]|eukprot:GAX75475.1 hypothetical protein CEUSTIGMA_g2918.t1 [Chlamydomonas eustigma]
MSLPALYRAFRPLGYRIYPELFHSIAYATISGVEDTHDDFKPKYNEQPCKSDQAQDVIKADISTHPVFLYMKGVPDAPNCGFSNMACRVLDAYGVKYGSRNVLADANIREGIKKFTEWPTIPQIFVKGEFVGGADILMSMHENGELEKLLDPIRKAQKSAS